MISKNKTTQKIISAFLIISILMPAVVLLSRPQKVNAQSTISGVVVVEDVAKVSWLQKVLQGFIVGSSATTAVQQTTDTGLHIKDYTAYLVRLMLQTAARRLLTQMTQATVNWINSGFHGQPLFLERPGAFFKDIAKSQIKDLVNIIGYNSSSYPFGKSFAINVIEGYKSTFAQNAQYSLSKVINDPVLLNNYRNNFSVGGWNGFMMNTQYPQNNYIGAQLMYANQLAQMLEGTGDSPANIIKDTLKQGQGFLSPQTCPSNPNYNNLKNEFQRPVFKCSAPAAKVTVCTSLSDADYDANDFKDEAFEDCDDENRANKQARDRECNAQEAKWFDPKGSNVCPGGLVNTTPGSVVGAQIMKALTGPYDQTSLAAAMGNSLSAIFDALLNKFMSSGLNALTSKKNSTDNTDDFSYDGHTLGSPNVSTTGSGGLDFGGPDEIIVLSTFKGNVRNAIDNANKELKLIDSNDVNNPGILQMFSQIWPKVQELDMCLPGPNLGWPDRTDEEVQKNITADETANNALKSAAEAFKEWVTNKINIELPGSINYLNAVNSIKTNQNQNDELVARKNAIIETLTSLESMQRELNPITVDPVRGSLEEATEIRLKQRLDGMIINISNTNTVNEMQNKLADAKYKLTNLDGLITKCGNERITKGWSNPGGENSVFNNSSTDTEKYLFCSSFIDPALSCDVIYNASSADYKKNSSN